MLSFRVFARMTTVAMAACGAVLFACGGAELSPLDEAPAFANTADSSVPTPTPDSSISPQPNPGSGKDSGVSKDSGTKPPPSDDSGSGEDSSPSEDAGEDSALPTDPGIPCGSGKAPCDPSTKVCCISTDNSGNPSYECESSNSCNNKGGLALPCASAADCTLGGNPGTVCCVTQQGGTASSVACVPASQCQDPGNDAWMCDQYDTQCPPSLSCSPSTTTIPPYSICQ
jgi:hypothetical protein